MLVGLLGFAMVTQVHSNQQDDTYAGLRSSDLVQLLNGLNAEARRADKEIADLEQTRSQLSDSTQRREAALKRATEESTTLGILAGTLPAQGPGIRIEVTDPKDKVTLNNLLDGVEELRAAGAEAIEFNDDVRVVAQTSFEDAERGVVVDGRRISAPYVIDVIGNPDTLATTLDFIGGFSFDVKASDGDVKVNKLDNVKITTVTKPAVARLRLLRRRPVTFGTDRAGRAAAGDTQGARVIPDDLKYTAEHEWVRQPGEAEGSVRVGITDYAQDALGDIVYVQLPEAGTSMSAGEVLGELESTKSVSEVYAPVAGEVVARNESLDATPELVNSDPYGAGWLFEIVPGSQEDIDALMDATAYGDTLEG